LTIWDWFFPARRKRTREGLPSIDVSTTADFYKVFTSPNPVLSAAIHNIAGDQVGTARYSISPLSDRVYVFDIRIAPHHQRHGYGTAMLCYLAKEYGQPITPIHEVESANEFWGAARRYRGAGLSVTEDISISEMALEATRWQHLAPIAECLDKLITRRLSVDREPWHVAVGRGFGAEDNGDAATSGPAISDDSNTVRT